MNVCDLLKYGDFQEALRFIRGNCGKSEVHKITKTSDVMKLARAVSNELDLSECKKILVDFWKFSVVDEKEIVFAMKSKREARLFVIGVLSERVDRDEVEEVLNVLKEIAPFVFDWETCDQLAAKVIVKILKVSKKVLQLFDVWISHPNVWTRRLPISTIPPASKFCQECIKYLIPYLEKVSDSKEKPLRRAYEWAKREVRKVKNL